MDWRSQPAVIPGPRGWSLTDARVPRVDHDYDYDNADECERGRTPGRAMLNPPTLPAPDGPCYP